MAKLTCLCGNELSNVRSPNKVEGVLINDSKLGSMSNSLTNINDIKDMTGDNAIWDRVNDLGLIIWECDNCGRLAAGDNPIKWYKPEYDIPGNLLSD